MNVHPDPDSPENVPDPASVPLSPESRAALERGIESAKRCPEGIDCGSFAQQSALSGAARVLDLGATFDSHHRSATPTEDDTRALLSDLTAVFSDIESAGGDRKL